MFINIYIGFLKLVAENLEDHKKHALFHSNKVFLFF